MGTRTCALRWIFCSNRRLGVTWAQGTYMVGCSTIKVKAETVRRMPLILCSDTKKRIVGFCRTCSVCDLGEGGGVVVIHGFCPLGTLLTRSPLPVADGSRSLRFFPRVVLSVYRCVLSSSIGISDCCIYLSVPVAMSGLRLFLPVLNLCIRRLCLSRVCLCLFISLPGSIRLSILTVYLTPAL